MPRYGHDFDERLRQSGSGRRAGRPARYDREGGYYGYGTGGYYGASMYGGGRYGGDYLGAWSAGGWSREHGRDLYRWNTPPRGARGYDRGLRYRGAGPYTGGATAG